MCGILLIPAKEGIEYIQPREDSRSWLRALQIQCGNDGKRRLWSGLNDSISKALVDTTIVC